MKIFSTIIPLIALLTGCSSTPNSIQKIPLTGDALQKIRTSQYYPYGNDSEVSWEIYGSDLVKLEKLWIPEENEVDIDIPELYSIAKSCLPEVFGDNYKFMLNGIHMLSCSHHGTNYYYAVVFRFMERRRENILRGGNFNYAPIPVYFDGTVVKPTLIKSEIG